MLGALSLLLNGGGLEQIKTITHELDQTLSGHTADVRSLLSQAMTLTTSLNTQKSRILTAIDHLDTLAATLNRQKQMLAGALDTLPQAVQVLADEKNQFVTLLSSLDRLSTVAVTGGQRRHRQFRLGAEEPGPGDDRADQGRRCAAEVAGVAGNLSRSQDLGERGAWRLHQPLLSART